jgi:hypothetical protein
MQHKITPLFAIPLFQTHLGNLNIITKTWLKNLEYPSHLEHTVPGSDSKDTRYSLAFNCFARGHMGFGTGQITL